MVQDIRFVSEAVKQVNQTMADLQDTNEAIERAMQNEQSVRELHENVLNGLTLALWLAESYGLTYEISHLRVSDLDALADRVNEAIVEAVTTFKPLPSFDRETLALAQESNCKRHEWFNSMRGVALNVAKELDLSEDN